MEERLILSKSTCENIDPLKTVVFFGCRNKEVDFLCKDFLISLDENKIITLFPAFSREQSSKVYVQHKIKENQKIISKILMENSEKIRIYISGTAKYMPQQVKESLIEALSVEIGIEKAKFFFNNLIKKGLFVIEAW